jgi:hypothetical protein
MDNGATSRDLLHNSVQDHKSEVVYSKREAYKTTTNKVRTLQFKCRTQRFRDYQFTLQEKTASILIFANVEF